MCYPDLTDQRRWAEAQVAHHPSAERHTQLAAVAEAERHRRFVTLRRDIQTALAVDTPPVGQVVAGFVGTRPAAVVGN